MDIGDAFNSNVKEGEVLSKNKEGTRIVYDRDFLLKCLIHKTCRIKPETLAGHDTILSPCPRLSLDPFKPIPALSSLPHWSLRRVEESEKADKNGMDPVETISLRPQSGNFSGGCAPSIGENNIHPFMRFLPSNSGQTSTVKGKERQEKSNRYPAPVSGNKGDENKAARERYTPREKERKSNNSRKYSANRGAFSNDYPPQQFNKNRAAGFHRGYDSNRKGYHDFEREEEPEPEWFSDGPTSRNDTIELSGFVDDERADKQKWGAVRNLTKNCEPTRKESSNEEDKVGDNTEKTDDMTVNFDELEKILNMDDIPGIFNAQEKATAAESKFSRFFHEDAVNPKSAVGNSKETNVNPLISILQGKGALVSTANSKDDDSSKTANQTKLVEDMTATLRNILLNPAAKTSIDHQPKPPAPVTKTASIQNVQQNSSFELKKLLEENVIGKRVEKQAEAPKFNNQRGADSHVKPLQQPNDPRVTPSTDRGPAPLTSSNVEHSAAHNHSSVNGPNWSANPPFEMRTLMQIMEWERNTPKSPNTILASMILQSLSKDILLMVIESSHTEPGFEVKLAEKIAEAISSGELSLDELTQRIMSTSNKGIQNSLCLVFKFCLVGTIAVSVPLRKSPQLKLVPIPPPILDSHRHVFGNMIKNAFADPKVGGDKYIYPPGAPGFHKPPARMEVNKDMNRRSNTPVPSIAFTPTSVIRKMTAETTNSNPSPMPQHPPNNFTAPVETLDFRPPHHLMPSHGVIHNNDCMPPRMMQPPMNHSISPHRFAQRLPLIVAGPPLNQPRPPMHQPLMSMNNMFPPHLRK